MALSAPYFLAIMALPVLILCPSKRNLDARERERERDLVVSVEDEWIGGMVDLTPQMGFEETFVGV